MPVHATYRDGVLRLVVDGDYTPGELQRVEQVGLGLPDVVHPTPLMLDLSGAAGVPDGEAFSPAAIARLLGSDASQVSRIAILTSAEAPEEDDEGMHVPVQMFGNPFEAVDWLKEEA